MNAALKRLTQSKFVRNVAVVATGTAGAQALSFIFAPVITRLYGPEAFGVLGVFVALIAVLGPMASLAYPIAIVLPKNDHDARGLGWLSFYISLLISSAIGIALYYFGARFLTLIGSEAIIGYMVLIPFAMLFTVLSQIGQQWLIRKKLFKLAAKAAVAHSLAVNSAKTGVGFFNPLASALIVITTVGSLFHAALVWFGTRSVETGSGETGPREQLPAVSDFSPVNCLRLARKYYDFPLYRAPQILINSISQSLPVLMLASFVGPSAAGFYALARTVLSMPTRLIGNSVFSVFYPRFNEAAQNKEDLVGLLMKSTGALAISGILPFGIVALLGPWLFGLIFGDDWVTTGEYARWLSLWLYAAFLNRPSVAAIATLSLQGLFLVYEVVSVAARLIALYLGLAIYANDILAVAVFSLVGVVLNASLVAITLLKARNISESK
jgi:O-antigen/teichoic acid export membrane protein